MSALATNQRQESKPFKPQERASNVLKAMGNEHRLKILCHLSRTEASVKELEVLTGLSQSALSQHLAKLRQERLVKTRRHAQTIYYSLEGPVAMEILQALKSARLI
ncbi:MAG: metalloregulator ArsR/SmtB family transcription factor [Rhodospirillales bacterium]